MKNLLKKSWANQKKGEEMDIVEALEAMGRGYENNLSEYDPDAYAAHFIIVEAFKEIKRLRGGFKEKVIELMNAFVEATGEQPTRIHIPKSVEVDILRLTYDDIGPLVNDVNEVGTRAAFGKIFGMEVVWDAEEFKVEVAEAPVEANEEEANGASEEKSE